MKTILIPLICIQSILCFGQNKLDSLKNLINQKSINETTRIDLLNELAIEMRREDRQASFDYASQALALSTKIGYKNGEGKALLSIGSYHLAKSAFEKSLKCSLDAMDIFENTEDELGLMQSLTLLGITYRHLREINYADKYLKQSLQLAIKLKHENEIGRIYNSLGLVATDRSNTKEAIQNYIRALSYLKQNSHIKVNILGNIAQAYLLNKDTTKAQKALKEALSIANVLKDSSGLAFINLQLGLLYKTLNNLPKAEEHFLICERLATELNDKKYLSEVYLMMVEIKMKNKKIDDALSYQKKFVALKDSIFNTDKARYVADMITAYESNKKEQTINLLKKDRQIQAILTNTLIIGLLLATGAAFLIYKLQRSRSLKTRQLLEVQHLLNNRLKDIDKFKSRFFANITHEFRTPLTLIIAPTNEELRENLPDIKRERFLLIKRNATRLLDLVNQLMDLSKLDEGKMELRVKEGNIEPILNNLAFAFDSFAQNKEVNFIKRIHLDAKSVWFDRDKIEKILSNLLTNAFKFTPSKGTVSMLAAILKEGNKRILSIIISDTGKGVPTDEQQLVFSSFYQASNTFEYQGGNGLGLSLVKEMIKLYGGSISMQSNEGTGTSVYVELPIDKESFLAEQISSSLSEEDTFNYNAGPMELIDGQETFDRFEQEEQEEQEEAEKDTLLIVEDNEDLLSYISSTLKPNFNIITARNGEEALQISLRVIPSLILTDLIMPKMDGLQLTQKIKSDERTSHIPVILLTAKNELESRLEGLKTGADDYLTKPFSNEEILIRVINLIEQRKHLAERFRERNGILNTHSPESSLDSRFLKRAKQLVEEGLGNYEFSVEIMSEQMNLSRTQLLRKLKALTTLTPNEFIKDIRLKKAADLILKKTDTITQIGYIVGFNDQSYFTKCFKKKFGVTPRDYSLQFESAKTESDNDTKK